jgi:hypothetical protein
LLNGDAQYPLTKVIVFADGNHPKRKLFQHQLMYCIHVLLYLDFQRKRSSFLQRMVLNQPDEVKSLRNYPNLREFLLLLELQRELQSKLMN